MAMNAITFSELFALSHDAVLAAEDGAVLFANRAASELFGGDVTGRLLRELLPELALNEVGETFRTETEAGGRACTVTGSRTQGVLLLTLRGRETGETVPRAVLASMRSRLFTMKHSLDTLSEEESFPPEQSRAYHDYYALRRAVEQLELVGRIETNEWPAVSDVMDLAVVVDELVGSVNCFLGGKAPRILSSVPYSECLFVGERDRVERILLILLSNALRHAGDGAAIEVTLQERTNGFYTVTVEDYGSGFSEEALRDAFLRHGETDDIPTQGAGLGLFIAQGLARSLGGSLLLVSREGRGSRLLLRLPKPDECSAADVTLTEAAGPELILTELADVLPSETYQPMFLD